MDDAYKGGSSQWIIKAPLPHLRAWCSCLEGEIPQGVIIEWGNEDLCVIAKIKWGHTKDTCWKIHRKPVD